MKRDTKIKRLIAFILASALIMLQMHLVLADEMVPEEEMQETFDETFVVEEDYPYENEEDGTLLRALTEEEIEEKIVQPEKDAQYAENEIIVVFKEDVDAADAAAVLDEAKTVPSETVTDEAFLDDENTIASVQISEDASYEDAAYELAARQEVEYVQPNFLYTLPEDDLPEYKRDTLLTANAAETSQTGDAYYQWSLEAVNAIQAWDLIKTNGSVTVAVMDTGCDLTHPDLAVNIDQEHAYLIEWPSAKVGEVYFITRPEGAPLSTLGINNGDLGDDGHGTHVCGIVSSKVDNGIGTAGVSYNASILPVCVFATGYKDEAHTQVDKNYATTRSVANAYNYVFGLIDAGELDDLRVINLSLGSYGAEDASTYDRLLHQSIGSAKDRGIVTVVAGGNENTSQYNYPSDHAECVSVVALDESNWKTNPWRTSFSDYNDAKDITSPGYHIISTVPQNTGSMGGHYAYKSGTSMAAPYISGILALVFAANPGLSADEAIEILHNSATDLTNNGAYPGKDVYTGSGLVNAYNAVLMAQGEPTPTPTSTPTPTPTSTPTPTPTPKPTATPTPKPTPTPTPVPSMTSDKIVNGGIYILHLKADTTKVLDIYGASVKNKANLQIYKDNGTDAQRFIFLKNSDGSWKIVNYNSGLPLAAEGNKTANKTNVYQNSAETAAAMKWNVKTNTDGSITITAKTSGLALDIYGGKTANKTNAQLYKSNGTDAQKFYAKKKGTIPLIPGTYTAACAKNKNYVIDVYGASANNKANIQIYKKNGTNAQKFTFELTQKGYYTIKTSCGKVLDVASGKAASGTNVWQYTANGTDAQKWKLTKDANGSYEIRSALGAFVLDVYAGKMANKSNVQIWKPNGTDAQRYYLSAA